MPPMFRRLVQALAVSALLAGTAKGTLAQAPTEPSIHFMRGIGMLTGMIGSCPMLGGMSAFADSRVAFLRSELAITEVQEPVWLNYAAALKKHLNGMLSMQDAVLQVLEAKTPVDRMRSYVKAMEIRIGSLKELEGPLATLYAALSPEQQARSEEILTGMGCTM